MPVSNIRPTMRAAVLLVLAGLSATAVAGDPDTGTLPAWDQLTPAQRELLIAPMRERWNAEPEQRARMLLHAQRWQQLSPPQRERAHRGVRRWQHMDPAQRAQTRALFEAMRTVAPGQARAFRGRWWGMPPGRRGAWLQAHPPAARRDRGQVSPE